jgi:hypothetical protein
VSLKDLKDHPILADLATVIDRIDPRGSAPAGPLTRGLTRAR